MRKFKKALAFALASAMIVSVVPVSAATSNTAKAGKSTIYYNGNASYKSTWVKTTTKKGYTTKFFNQSAKVATLNKKTGKVTAKKAGTAQIKVNFYKSGKYVGNKIVKISVKKAPVAYGIKLENATLNVGETTNVVTSNGVKVNCYSADKSGKVTAVAPGTTKIAVRNAYTSKKVYVDVTVNAVDAPAAKQTGAKTITVTNGVSMKDRTVTVTRGSEKVALASKDGIVFNEDGTGITITTASNLADATYTVTVGDKTSEVKAELSKVNKISILSDKAAVVNTSSGSSVVYGKAQVGYKVENQFGEDITSTTSLSVSGSDTPQIDAKNHRITFTRANGNPYILGRDVISVVLVHTETGKSAQATLTVSNEAAADSIEFNGVWNREGKTFTDDVNLNDDPFYLLFTVKDQYGMTFKDYKNVNVNQDLHVSILGGLTGLTVDTTRDNFVVVTKDGVDYLAIRIRQVPSMTLKAGTAQVLVISGGTGKSVQNDFELQVGGRVETLSVNPPAYVPAGEEVQFDYTALDANGNAVTSYEHLKDVKITGANNLSWEKGENGKALLVWDGTTGVTNPGKGRTTLQTYGFETLSHKFTHLQVTVNEQARPVAIDGLKDVSTSLSATSGAAVTIKVKNLVILDQYGREMTDDLLNNALNATGIYSLDSLTATIRNDGLSRNVIKLNSGIGTAPTGETPATTRIIDLTNNGNYNYTADTTLFNVAINGAGQLENVAAILNLQIQNAASGNDALTNASQDVRFEVVKTDYIESAQVEVDKIYVPTDAMQKTAGGSNDNTINAAYQQNIIVKHQGAILPQGDYEVRFERSDLLESVNGSTKDGLTVHAVKLKAGIDQSNISGMSSNQEVTTKVYVTLKSGEEITQEVVLSKEAPKIAKIDVDKTVLKSVTGTSITADSLAGSAYANVSFEDQYGKSATLNSSTGEIAFKNGTKVDVEYVVENYDNKEITVTNNGKHNATITVNTAVRGAKFNLVIKVGSLSKTVRVTLW